MMLSVIEDVYISVQVLVQIYVSNFRYGQQEQVEDINMKRRVKYALSKKSSNGIESGEEGPPQIPPGGNPALEAASYSSSSHHKQKSCIHNHVLSAAHVIYGAKQNHGGLALNWTRENIRRLRMVKQVNRA